MAGTETYTEWRLTWDYPYLRNNGMVEQTVGTSKENARQNAMANEGYYYAGREIKWEKRQKTVTTTDWEEVTE